MSTVFIAVNGDDVGDSIGQAVASDNHEELSRISGTVKNSHSQIDEFIKQAGGRVIASSGDEGIYQAPASIVEQLESIRADYAQSSGHTLTVGVGNSVSEASKALLYGKYNEKDQIVHYEPAIEDYINSEEQDYEQEEAQPEGEIPSSEDVQGDMDIQAEQEVGMEGQEEFPQPSETSQDAIIAPEMEEAAQSMEEQGQEQDQATYENDGIGADDAMANEKDNVGLDTDSVGEEETSEIIEGVAGSEGEGGVEDETEGIDGDIDGQDPQAVDEQLQAESEMEGEAGTVDENDESHEDLLTNMVSGHMGEEEEMQPEHEQAMGEEEEFAHDAQENMEDEADSDIIEADEEMGEEYMPEGEESEDGSDDELKSDITNALMAFKQNKQMLEETQQSNPELYQATITMLRAMIEMSKRLGFVPQGIEGEEDYEEEAPQEMGESDIAGGNNIEEEYEEEEESEKSEPEMPPANSEEDEDVKKQ